MVYVEKRKRHIGLFVIKKRRLPFFVTPPPPPVANHTSMNLRVTGAMGGPPPQCLPIRLCCRKAATGPSGAE